MKQILRKFIKYFLQKNGYTLSRSSRVDYRSETSKCRPRLAPFCMGYGLDIGFGGDPITDSAIRIDQPLPYAQTGGYPVQLGGDATHLEWFRDGVLDFVYSSHLLEDFEDTEAVIYEWLRVLKEGGRLVLFCPNEQIYRKHCEETGQIYNTNHKHPDFSLDTVKRIIERTSICQVIHEASLVDIYSWELVVEKV